MKANINKKRKVLFFLAISMPFIWLTATSENVEPTYPKCIPSKSVPDAGTPVPLTNNGRCTAEGLYCVELTGVGCTQHGMFVDPVNAYCDSEQQVNVVCELESKEQTQGIAQQGCSSFGAPFLGNCTCEYTGVEDFGNWRSQTWKVCK